MQDTTELDITVELGEAARAATIDTDVDIVGDPLHRDSDSLVDAYKNSPKQYLREEARHSCGDYVLVDTRDGLELITSFGYVGGYLYSGEDHVHVASRLGTILSEVPAANISIDSDALIYYLFMSPWFRLPFSSMFDDIYRVPPGTTLTVTEDGFKRTSYLSERTPPSSYDDVMAETVGELDDAEVVVSLSGGVDSASLACACMEHDVDARAVTFNIGPGQTNDVTRGMRVADKLGIDHDVLPLDRPTKGDLADDLEASMRQDLFLTTNERIGFLALRRESNGDVGISGMGPDPLAHRRMYPGPVAYETYQLLNPKNLIDESLNRVGHRMLHTDFFFEHPRFRKAYLHLASRLYPRLNRLDDRVDKGLFGTKGFEVLQDSSMESVLKGQISTEIPNIVWTAPDRLAVTQRKEGVTLDVFMNRALFHEQFGISFLDREIDVYKNLLRTPLTETANPIEQLLFYAFCQNTQKGMSNFMGEEFIPLRGPICWGPSVSYFLNKRHPLLTKRTKKHEITSYVDRQLGTSYSDLVADIPEQAWNYPKQSTLMERHSHRFSQDNSTVLSYTPESALLSSIYDDIHEMAKRNEIVNKQQNRFLNKVLNLELLLDSAVQDG
jgi:hypothetical protein